MNEILALKTKHSTSISSFSWQYTSNFNCFYLYTSMWTRAKHGLEFRYTQGREYCDLSSVT